MNSYKFIVDTTSDFKKDYKRVIKQGKNINKLKEIIDILANGDKIPAKYKDHKLTNNKKYSDCRELHIEPDWLLIYRIIEDEFILILLNTGSHSDLF